VAIASDFDRCHSPVTESPLQYHAGRPTISYRFESEPEDSAFVGVSPTCHGA
jgi:hypothetical protein